MASPLQLLLFRHTDDRETFPYEESLLRAFQGGKEAGGYLATGEDLGCQLELFEIMPPRPAAETLDGFCHTLVMVLVDRDLLDRSGNELWDWLQACWAHVRASNGRHSMIVAPLDERVGREFSAKRPGLDALQLLHVHEFGEHAIRPSMLAMRMIHECRILLARALPTEKGVEPGFLRLFISHAKMDGLPLAVALERQIQDLKWLPKFYDANDLPAGCDWQFELERGVGSSLIIMLRTDGYDGRPWCQQEVLWADEYATPAVLVDARTMLNHPVAHLPFDRVPTVRIPDGNLVRILFLALREGLRFLYFMRRVEEMKKKGDLPTSPDELRVFSFRPSMPALMRACGILAAVKGPATTSPIIIYPDPPFRAGMYEAANALVAAYAPAGTRLLTPNTLAATKGAVV